MFELPAQYVDDETRRLSVYYPDARLRLAVGSDERSMDRVELTIDANVLSFELPRFFTSEERFRFFIVSAWSAAAHFLVSGGIHALGLSGTTRFWVDDFPRGPGLVFSRDGVAGQLAIPDPYFIGSRGYLGLRPLAPITREQFDRRQRCVFWRGASTGMRSRPDLSWLTLPRFVLCQRVSRSPFKNSLDVGISTVVQIHDLRELAEIEASGFVRNSVDLSKFSEYRYSIDIDGNSNSWPGLFTKMLAGLTVLKVESEQGYSQWYYERLIPWVHFIPILSTMEDLDDKVDWVLSHDDESFAIASAAQRLALEMTFENERTSTADALRSFFTSGSSSWSG